MNTIRLFLFIVLFAVTSVADAQRFFKLTADEVEVDSVLPSVSYCMPLPENYQDSVYSTMILYPDFVDLPQHSIDMYNKYFGEQLPAMPEVRQDVITTQKKASMLFNVCPLVYRDGKYQALVDFKLEVTATARPDKGIRRAGTTKASRYADHSILASGRWGKIRVAESGFHQLTEATIRKAGFKDINKVKIYGYGGNLVPEVLTDSYLRETDDLMEVESSIIGGKRVFYAKGPVSWSSNTATERTRNPYSNYGYYFITENDDAANIVDQETLQTHALAQNSPDFYHALYEVDNYAWYQGGRNLVESTPIQAGKSKTYVIPTKVDGDKVTKRIAYTLSSGTEATYKVLHNGQQKASSTMTLKSYDKAVFATKSHTVTDVPNVNDTITVTCVSGGPLRLDNITVTYNKQIPMPDLAGALPEAEYVYNITNQDHHADEAVNLTIIIPTTQELLEQATRLKKHHEERDGITVRIVPADELYNEFSSGTPDVSAYRRYMKMMYDRSTSDATMPKHLLLFGDCVWDNRLLTAECRSMNQDRLLLCFESENSYNEVNCFVSDDFIGMLDDNESLTSSGYYMGTPDIAIGRLPVLSSSLAKSVVDKLINYAVNANAGAWQNTIMFMGDDGNDKLHMRDVDFVAENVTSRFPGYNIRKVMWDAYKREDSSTGHRYPDVEKQIKNQQQAGALIMDYAGHGRADAISHEYVLYLSDFNAFTNTNLPIWITASCDIGPFDGTESSIGKSVILNANGGGMAFYGTTRTVYANYNKFINAAFVNNVLTIENGKPLTIGEANRRAKAGLVASGEDKTVNKLQYSLLGDPAMTLNLPMHQCVVDSIDGVALSTGNTPMIHANSIVRVAGHIEKNGVEAKDFKGLVETLVRDSRELQTCLNNSGEDKEPFTFYDRANNLYLGTDSVINGRFSINFAIPRDINYSDASGLITMFAYNNDASVTAHGETTQFLVGGSEEVFNDSIGPSVYCYLNSPSFVNGGNVNPTPYFVAEVHDKNGINATGSGIGHDIQLCIDNQMSMTYVLNDNFQFDFGTYSSGRTYFALPKLSEGFHTLRFRVWDILNNPTTTVLTFNVVKALDPTLFDVNVTQNPASASTKFIVTHDRPGSDVDVDVEIFDMSGRLLHRITRSAVSSSGTMAIDWDLKMNSGARLQTGVYLYRVRLGSDGSGKVSKAKKMIVI